MIKFNIEHTQKINGTTVDFEITLIEGDIRQLREFITFDTHHPVKWKILEIKDTGKKIILKCETEHFGIGWDDQFANSIIDTNKNMERYNTIIKKNRPTTAST